MMESQSARLKRAKSRVKSGCRTCKIRKVKCDEEHPICHRCISTGRVCDGYGIWGGGGNPYHSLQQKVGWKEHVIPRAPISFSLLASSTEEEKGCFDWFKSRVVPKIPGSFISGFWTTLLFQAALNEPAVLHAIIALSSIHRKGTITDDDQWITRSIPQDQEQFTLQHYVKAINALQPHFSTKSRTSLRIPLITCAIFVCLELLRGHFKTAQTHLQNGLKILEETKILTEGKDASLRMKASSDSADDWIVEAFSRLHLQAKLFKYTYQHSGAILQLAEPEAPILAFSSFNEVWQSLERLLNAIFHLNYQARELAISGYLPPPSLVEKQKQICASLVNWLEFYNVFVTTREGEPTPDEEKVYNMMYAYQTMATIMCDTCLNPSSETTYDSHTDQFVLLMKQLTGLSTYTLRSDPVPATPGQRMDMARSIIDIGWIPLLHYVVVKCRIHRIRLQAVRFLETSPHREGFWDAQTTACVARKLIEIEEKDFYRNLDTADDFVLASPPTQRDLELPVVPESYRIRELEVVLSGAPLDQILLFGKKKYGDIECRVLLSEFNVRLQCWIDDGHDLVHG